MKLMNNLSIDTLMKPYEDGYFSEDQLDCIRWGLKEQFRCFYLCETRV